MYHGRTEFTGLHTGDVLGGAIDPAKKGFGLDYVFQVYPEYYILEINKFNDLAKDTLDEWIYYFRNNVVKPGSQAKGLAWVQQKLAFEGLSLVERQVYVKDIEKRRSQPAKHPPRPETRQTHRCRNR